MKNKRKRYTKVIGWILILTPLWMHVIWRISPRHPLNILIIDKTVPSLEAHEHRSLVWVLRNERYTKNNDELYMLNKDYSGFFPTKGDKEYQIQDLSQYSDAMIDSLSDVLDAVFITDTYGIYADDLPENQISDTTTRLIYGGLRENELDLITNMKEKGKLILTEFNTIASPTNWHIRKKFQEEFDISWSGWTGRFFDELDLSLNPELPAWIPEHYEKQDSIQWHFSGSGIVLVHLDSRIVILAEKTHLSFNLPVIMTTEAASEKYDLPKRIRYPYWFDITFGGQENDVLASYELHTNEVGDSLLAKFNIPKRFPAMIVHDKQYKFYYFAGDWSDSPVHMFWTYFRGISFFRHFLYNWTDINDRKEFFWNYYLPLTRNILSEQLN
ncbi:MAG: hypothetical protein P9L92_09845 [Candidatus Electryonea clarkiae]|nr:hypothetical protein [Candidatus Electryonea clarkiae]